MAFALVARPGLARAASPTASPVNATATNQPPEASPSTLERPQFPRLVFAGGPLIGPHAIGNEDCRNELARCEKRGTFFGVGVSAELRARLYRPLYVHARAYVVGNVAPNDRIYTGLGGAALGLGAYGRRLFGRAEVLVLGAFGDNSFTPPFHATPSGRDSWGRTAGLISAGFRQPFAERLGAELWGGLMIGPKSERTVPSAEPERRVLTTFMVGLNLFVDVLR